LLSFAIGSSIAIIVIAVEAARNDSDNLGVERLAAGEAAGGAEGGLSSGETSQVAMDCAAATDEVRESFSSRRTGKIDGVEPARESEFSAFLSMTG
jgi:hypothetical protein